MNNCELYSILAVVFMLGLTMAASADAPKITLHPKCSYLPFFTNWWIAQTPQKDLLMIDAVGVSKSEDGGASWSPVIPAQLPENTKLFRGTAGSLLLCTSQGTLILFYMDQASQKWGWNKEENKPDPSARLDAWACRSEDGGKTWTHCQKVVDGYCGALIDAKQLSTGEIVAVMQDMLMNEARHYVYTIISSDDGKTWKRGNNIDLGGRGDHDGGIEPTIVELSDNRVMMLIRTNLDQFWTAFSDTRGLYWRELRPSGIKASSSPGFLLKLASGRIALVWNRECAEDQRFIERNPPPSISAEIVPSWFRKELSISFSDDNGVTWSKPIVIASTTGKEICYPYMLERTPGEIWVIIRIAQGQKISFSLREDDFLSEEKMILQ